MQKKEVAQVDQNAILRQSNELVEANYKLTTAEQKVILNFIAQLDITKDDFEVIRIGAKSLSEACGFNPKSGYRQLQQVLKKLLNRSVILQKRDGTGWYGSHWVQSCDYVKLDDGGTDCSYVEYELDKRLCSHFLQLRERFLKSDLKSLVSFSHVYSTRFYMIFKNKLKIGHIRYTFQELQKILELPKTYGKSTSNIKGKVIKVAVEEINNKSDILVEYAYYKSNGRAHVGVEFSFRPKGKIVQIAAHGKIDDGTSEDKLYDNQQKIYDRLVNRGVSTRKAKSLVKTYDLTVIENNLRYAVQQKDTSTNLPGLIITFIEQDVAGQNAKAQKEAQEREAERQKDRRQAYEMFHGTAEVNTGHETEITTSNDELNDIEVEFIQRKGEKAGAFFLKKMERLGLTVEDVRAGKRN